MRIGRTICAAGLAALAGCEALSLCGTTRTFTLGGAFTVTAVSAAPSDSIPKEIDLGTDRVADANREGRLGAFEDLWGGLFEGTALPSGAGLAVTVEGGI